MQGSRKNKELKDVKDISLGGSFMCVCVCIYIYIYIYIKYIEKDSNAGFYDNRDKSLSLRKLTNFFTT
jgi:hypothetical protein